MTKETPDSGSNYRVQVDYRAGGTERTPTVLVLRAGGASEARRLGRALFAEWVDYHRAHGYRDFMDLSVTRVTCTFVDSRDAREDSGP